jgi:hypothetical protein
MSAVFTAVFVSSGGDIKLSHPFGYIYDTKIDFPPLASEDPNVAKVF